MPRRVVVASDNRGKLREFQQLLGARWELIAQSALGIGPIVETGSTFGENALLKARHAASLSGLPALADDSGIEVDALGGAPGVRSARYAGEGADDEANTRKLLEALRGIPEPKRTARFRCALVYLEHPDDPLPVIAEGVWEGLIGSTPRGNGGFGYDPVFIDPSTGCTAAELDPSMKNERSHRGDALRQLASALANKNP